LSSFLKRRTQLKKTNKKSEHFSPVFGFWFLNWDLKKGALGNRDSEAREEKRERGREEFFFVLG
jgi:hypothetical protein